MTDRQRPTGIATTLADHLRMRPRESDKRVLVLQGGGMRAIYSMGALTALEDAGLREVFDVIIGSSGGAINGAYFLAGQAHEAVDVYIDHLSNQQFVNPLRFWKVVDIDYLVDYALKVAVPLNLSALHDSPCLLEAVLTDAETAEPIIVTNHDDGVDFFEVIRATAALPALYNGKVRVGEKLYVDGGASDAVPVMRAVESAATELLAVLTRGPGFRRTQQGKIYRTVGRAMARGQSKAVKDLIGVEDVRFNNAMEVLEKDDVAHDNLAVWTVWPSDPRKLVGRTTSDKRKLRACAQMGREDMQAVLAQPLQA